MIRVKELDIGQAQIIDYDSKEQCVYLSSSSNLSNLKGPALRLVVDLTWLIEVLIDKLKSRTTESLLCGPLKGFLESNIIQQDVKSSIPYWRGKLNQSQEKAYNSSIYKDVTLIWGPPGTGKSFTLSHIVLSLSQVAGKTVVSCISNAALDALIVGFLKVLESYKEKYPFAVVDSSFVRLGVSRTPAVLDSKVFYPEDTQLSNWKMRLNEIRDKLGSTDEQGLKVVLKKEQNEIYKKIKEHNQTRINRAKVIFTTAAQFTALTTDKKSEDNSHVEVIGINLSGIAFDNIVLDEVSMMYPPQFIGLCQDVTKRIIAAGDFRQLGPIHLSATALALCWLGNDVFTFGRIFDSRKNIIKKNYLAQLLEQWRSHPRICNLINQPFYEGKLISKADGVKDNDPLMFRPFSGIPIAYINLESDKRNLVKRSSKGSRSNSFSGKITAFLANWVAEGSPEISVGVVTPYRAQVAFVKSELHKKYSSRANQIKVGSIHSFQGDEADVIIYDIVDAPNEKIGLLYQDETGERLLNVAISRAKRKLILVGDIQNMHDGKGHTLVSDKIKQIISSISKFTKVEKEIHEFINQI